jgi:pimeloyl-ACP methyl ester carboxylesterase
VQKNCKEVGLGLQDFGEHWVDSDGVRTRYFEAGEGGTPVVLIHGGQLGDSSGGENAEDWEPTFRAFAKAGRVIAFDRLGQGYTDNPKRDEDCTMAGTVRHTTAFLKALNLGRCNLVGHSCGGYIAGAIALAEPALVNACVIVDSASAAPGEGRNSAVFATNPHAPGSLESSRFVYERYSRNTAHVTDEWLAMKQKITDLPKNREMIARMNSKLLAARFLPDFVGDRDRFFIQINSDGFRRPVMIVWGYNDPTAPLDMGLALFDIIAKMQPRTCMHVVNEAGHFSFREQPEAFNRAVLGFLAGVDHGE